METVTSRDGTAIAFGRSGAGPAIILVNGALATRAACVPWRRSWPRASPSWPTTGGGAAIARTRRRTRSSARFIAALSNAQQRILASQGHGADPEILAPVLAEFFAA